MLLLFTALVGLLAGLIIEHYVMQGRRGLVKRLTMVAGLAFLVWMLPTLFFTVRYDGYCYAFVFERWHCSFLQHIKHEARLDLFVFFPLYLVGMIFYIVTSVIVWRREGRINK